jgi:hypothetical protein
MAKAQEKLLSSRPAAIAAKNEFVQQYVEGHRDRSAGIGLNSEGDDWAVKVLVETPAAARDLPTRFHDIAVEVQVVGAASALDG